ncbi:MAG: tetratricopeptide repeat protein, partial [Spirochaetota bacterium]|nr:tetratricopeptide repeat protein [Spirochaetota bacterium]
IYYNLGELYFETNDLEKALSFYEKAIKILEYEKTPLLSKIYTSTGHLYRMIGKLNAAYSFYDKAYKINLQLSLKNQLAINHNNLGKILYLKGEKKKALLHYIAAYKKSDSTQFLLRAKIYNNFGEIYISMKQYDKAEVFLKRAIYLREDSLDNGKGVSYYHLGNLYLMKKDKQKALKYFMKAKEIFKDHHKPSLEKVNEILKKINED